MFLSNMGGVHNICNDNVMSFVSYCLFVTNLRMYMLSYMYELLDTNICAVANIYPSLGKLFMFGLPGVHQTFK